MMIYVLKLGFSRRTYFLTNFMPFNHHMIVIYQQHLNNQIEKCKVPNVRQYLNTVSIMELRDQKEYQVANCEQDIQDKV